MTEKASAYCKMTQAFSSFVFDARPWPSGACFCPHKALVTPQGNDSGAVTNIPSMLRGSAVGARRKVRLLGMEDSCCCHLSICSSRRYAGNASAGSRYIGRGKQNSSLWHVDKLWGIYRQSRASHCHLQLDCLLDGTKCFLTSRKP